MPIRSNINRAVFYSANDLAAGAAKERVCSLLRDIPCSTSDINDAIELIQCVRIVEECSYLFAPNDLVTYQADANKIRCFALKEAGSYFAKNDIASLYETLEIEYIEQFWEVLVQTKSYTKVNKKSLYELLSKYSYHLQSVIVHKPLVKEFDSEIKSVLIKNPNRSSELIINCFAVDKSKNEKFYLPESITNVEIDEIMLDYIASQYANLNYVRVLAKWPDTAECAYSPSPEVLVAAERRKEELNNALFSEGATIGFGITVAFSEDQRSCKSASFEGTELKYVYGTKWLRAYSDPGTILNNLIYVFELIDYRTGLLMFPSHRHESMSLIERLDIRSIDEYRVSEGASIRISQALMALGGYNMILEECDTRIEDAIAWFFNEHIEEEFGIKGFSVGMPSSNASYFDKCKAIGPEIERVIKAFSEYARKGVIDDAYFPYMTFKHFSDIPTLIEEKYIVEGEEYMQAAHWLFSDQSPLAYLSNCESDDGSCYSLVRNNQLDRSAFHVSCQSLIEQLIGERFLKEDSEGYLHASRSTMLLKRIWDEGAFSTMALSLSDKEMVEKLVDKRLVRIYDGLLSPDESDYCNFVFNSAQFSNPLALRNKYDHASSAALDPNGNEVRTDYLHLLLVLIGMTLKINEELCIVAKRGGVEDFVDWPLIEAHELA